MSEYAHFDPALFENPSSDPSSDHVAIIDGGMPDLLAIAEAVKHDLAPGATTEERNAFIVNLFFGLQNHKGMEAEEIEWTVDGLHPIVDHLGECIGCRARILLTMIVGAPVADFVVESFEKDAEDGARRDLYRHN